MMNEGELSNNMRRLVSHQVLEETALLWDPGSYVSHYVTLDSYFTSNLNFPFCKIQTTAFIFIVCLYTSAY